MHPKFLSDLKYETSHKTLQILDSQKSKPPRFITF